MKLHWGALRGLRPTGVSFAVAPGVGGGIRAFRKPDGSSGREYLDVGENPPNGAIIYYWLDDEDVTGPVSLAFHDNVGTLIARFRSDDLSLPEAKRPSVRPGLNRFVWDLKYPGPEVLDLNLAPPSNTPLAEPADRPSGPTVVPGQYRVEMSVGSQILAAKFSVVKDPRLSTTPQAYRRQFELLRELKASLGRVNATVNNIRRLKRRLAMLAGGAEGAIHDLAVRSAAVTEQLAAVEAVLVDVYRESPHDVLRHPAGLNDTLVDVINSVSISDTAPTTQAAAVAKEVMARVDAEIVKVERLVTTEIAAVNRLALEREVAAPSAD